ncbi:MAG: excinuclease ABC subunit B [Candidatus Ryanbacteria bacterium RIFCSPHIGHO2_02_FULL_48_12]|uniref:UvrABC system protein B n=1 Tax=Candidatus Ryanbacteria bacterium RIFCSPHIGHO2_01_FULL_48_27 TaxID=1802115 RepID=A0A1G2G8H4_9BACT|nr:MAG: excinuclease ABC subunit B [Candidatus Ryanbacteria bacterium RIFCSPHIGHO2_01_FULL_48_27]OGZ49166.1 MAG: excinuclease ABC subunit B [Candidatus Ryanbacteria bacterium RIFCSPHIGHO2_02_FULL_48_12]
MRFILHSQYKPTGDQPQAIENLVANLDAHKHHQTLLGVTGSGKTFTMANVIERTGRPTLVISPNKTLAAQLYQEFKEFFPENEVHYFVSYYDYYQPEAYIPQTDTYIEKDAKINQFIDGLRHAATQAILTRPDTIIVASVSCIYGIADPKEYARMALTIKTGDTIKRHDFLSKLAFLQYTRNDLEKSAGTFSVKGEVVEIVSPSGLESHTVEFFGNDIERMDGGTVNEIKLFPAKHFVTPQDKIDAAIENIRAELKDRLTYLKNHGHILEAERLEQKTTFDLEMLKSTGYCNGIENYARHISFRSPGDPSFTLIDYMPKDFLLFVDESHIAIPQIRGMYHGDKARKETLIEHGFRLPSALDNRPLRFEEFEQKITDTIYVSATPTEFELSRGPVVEQLVRPTGLLDPDIELRPTKDQINDLMLEIKKRTAQKERTLVTTISKRLAEDIADYLKDHDIKAEYLHSEVKTLERPKILRDLRAGTFDALVGVNLLREGLDMPEVSLVAILDADKEGFLRNATTLIQTMGRAARHQNGHVIMYADIITKSMRRAIDETTHRRTVQESYNREHGITPQAIVKEIRDWFIDEPEDKLKKEIAELKEKRSVVELRTEIEAEMLKAAAELNFERAAELRDILKTL